MIYAADSLKNNNYPFDPPRKNNLDPRMVLNWLFLSCRHDHKYVMKDHKTQLDLNTHVLHWYIVNAV